MYIMPCCGTVISSHTHLRSRHEMCYDDLEQNFINAYAGLCHLQVIRENMIFIHLFWCHIIVVRAHTSLINDPLFQ